MITIRDLAPDALRFEDLSAAEVAALLDATAAVIPRDGPEMSVPAEDAQSPVRSQGRVMWGPGFVWFMSVTAAEAERVSDAFRKLQGLPEVTARGVKPP
jgi:hypothetical protein